MVTKNGKTNKDFIMQSNNEPYNEQGNRHGLWILLCSRTNYVNGDRVGLREHKARFSKVIKKIYYAR